ncbi:MAG TPA: PTS sugar transporter subunit IIA [Xanthomonadaceae bacterium]|nr:PTS sugar transporter subunit IIA [Xanthomonadaceae bacterium]
MSVGILLVTHEGLGPDLVRLAQRMLGHLPLAVECMQVPFDADLPSLLAEGSGALRRADGGDGVLILSDLYGASPSNLASRLAHLGTPVRRVSGLSLPMLLRVLNYAERPLEELVEIAASGARSGVVIDHA